MPEPPPPLPPPARRGYIENSHQVTATRGAHDFISRRPAYSGPVVAIVATNSPPASASHPHIQGRRATPAAAHVHRALWVVHAKRCALAGAQGKRGVCFFVLHSSSGFCLRLCRVPCGAQGVLRRPWVSVPSWKLGIMSVAMNEPKMEYLVYVLPAPLPFARFAARSPHQGQGVQQRLCCSCPARPWMSACLLLRAGWGSENAGNELFRHLCGALVIKKPRPVCFPRPM